MIKIDWGKKLKDTGILWQHNGDMSKPHAILTSGKHSDGYSNGAKLVEEPQVLAEIVAGMIENTKEYLDGEVPDVIMGPAMGAITIGHEWARQLGTKFAFTEPVYTADGKMQKLKRFDIQKGAKVLVVEDMVTTGGSVKKTIDEIEKTGATVLSIVPIILDRTNGVRPAWGSEYKMVPLVILPIQSWESAKCPLCSGGSEALRPKSNWNKFNK